MQTFVNSLRSSQFEADHITILVDVHFDIRHGTTAYYDMRMKVLLCIKKATGEELRGAKRRDVKALCNVIYTSFATRFTRRRDDGGAVCDASTGVTAQ